MSSEPTRRDLAATATRALAPVGPATDVPAPATPAAGAASPELVATVSNVQRYSLHDGGGIRTNVFLKGCPFRCPWCCNPENLSREPEVSFKRQLCMGCSRFEPGSRLCQTPPELCPMAAKTWVGEATTVFQLLDQVRRDAAFYEESAGGVTVSGGEALLWPEFLEAFLAAAKAEGLNTALETTAAVPVPNLEGLAAVTDRWLVDFKVADRERSLQVTGIDPDLRDANLRRLVRLGADIVARMPIVPGHTDGRQNVAQNLDRIRELGIRRVDVLPFHQLGSGKYQTVGRDYTMADVPQLTDEDVAFVMDMARERGLVPKLHGE